MIRSGLRTAAASCSARTAKGVHDLYQKSVDRRRERGTAAGDGTDKVCNGLVAPTGASCSLTVRTRREAVTSGHCRWMETQSLSRSSRQISKNRDAQFSPDGKWIAYQSNESGRFEIYVQPFPGPRKQVAISTNGGTSSALAARREGIVLRRAGWPAHGGSHPSRVERPGPRRRCAGRAVRSPLGGAVQQADFRHQYMVSADGQRFLVDTVAEEANSPITVILNWKPKP